MENQEVSSKEIIKFYYRKSTRRPKRLENNVFVIYSPERIKLQPGEKTTVKMGIKIKFSKNIEGSCRILYSLSNYGLKLLNSNKISQEFNLNMDNFLSMDKNNLPPWTLIYSNYLTQILHRRFKLERDKKLGIFS